MRPEEYLYSDIEMILRINPGDESILLEIFTKAMTWCWNVYSFNSF